MNTKSFWKSKTIWANVGIAVVSAAADALKVHIDPTIWGLGVMVINMGLRFVTKQPLG